MKKKTDQIEEIIIYDLICAKFVSMSVQRTVAA